MVAGDRTQGVRSRKRLMGLAGTTRVARIIRRLGDPLSAPPCERDSTRGTAASAYFPASKAAGFPDVDRSALGDAAAAAWLGGRILVK